MLLQVGLFRAPKLGNTRLGHEITAFPTLYCYYAVIFAHIFKAFNRFLAVWFPTLYPRVFTTRNTFGFMGLGLLCAACINVPHHISEYRKPFTAMYSCTDVYRKHRFH
jgi:hypothetical protein